MEIFEIMDCVDCDDYQFIRGRLEGPPEDCYPDDWRCHKGYPNEPCDRMLGAIRDFVSDGQIETSKGYFATAEFLKSVQDDEDFIDHRSRDFSSAPYWFIFFDVGGEPIPYKNEKEIYEEVFS